MLNEEKNEFYERLSSHEGLIKITTALYWYTTHSYDKEDSKICVLIKSYKSYEEIQFQGRKAKADTAGLGLPALSKETAFADLYFGGDVYLVHLYPENVEFL